MEIVRGRGARVEARPRRHGRVPLRETKLDVERERERVGDWEAGLDAAICGAQLKKGL